MRTFLSIALVSVATTVCSNTQVAAEPANEVILASEVKWEQLNPARGDKSPKAGTLWGDRKGSVPTGFLVKFVDGFSSPPHIHNVSYRGVVISGLIHNDDPNAANMWMPTASFWTQPKGEVHITAAKGSTNVAYIEIEGGPYLVLPKKNLITYMSKLLPRREFAYLRGKTGSHGPPWESIPRLVLAPVCVITLECGNESNTYNCL